ncbi:hypothetical protein LCGC14_1513940 [marine sediment metagenome]|uniref:Uncharacterized protein n=1 Tax=marine sediment metagenome TaxID=412755 RepID=A0A0F9JLB0_9ZZZZ|nr:hypothetical protein [Pricia sp.]
MEELKLILETVQGLGGDMRWFAIVWLCLEFFEGLFIAGAWLAAAYLCYKVVRMGLAGNEFGIQVMKIFGGRVSYEGDQKDVLRWLSKQELPKL